MRRRPMRSPLAFRRAALALLALTLLAPRVVPAGMAERCPNLDPEQCITEQWNVYRERVGACRRGFDGTPHDVRVCVVGATSAWIAARNGCGKSVCRSQLDMPMTCCASGACCLTTEVCSETGGCEAF